MIGTEKTAPLAISLIVISLTFAFLAMLVFQRPALAEKEILLQGMFTILTTTIGYLFGYKTSGRS